MRQGSLGTAVAAACIGLSAASADASSLHRGQRHDVAPPSLARPEPSFPVNVTWTLSRLNDKPIVGDPPSFTLDDKWRATGFAGCNTFAMELYPVRGQKLIGSAIALTRKACDTPIAMRERSFLIGLHSQPRWSLDGPDLLITGYTGPMRFRRGI